MATKKIYGVEYLTAVVVVDGHVSLYGVRANCKQAFIDSVHRDAAIFEHDTFDLRFTGVFYLDSRNITSQRPWYPLF